MNCAGWLEEEVWRKEGTGETQRDRYFKASAPYASSPYSRGISAEADSVYTSHPHKAYKGQRNNRIDSRNMSIHST